ncbi:MAG TPA: adenylate/guanylate cyclase domain-containing protein [Solirubrobacterales bacterium]|jgi:class 3 adenylate cyclase|nr:adenylate/guanylate cyclase domain-containing protein [Solirubrobacterales bacterium]
MQDSPVRYVRSEDGRYIAYRTMGAGKQDYLIVLPSLGTIEMLAVPPAKRLMRGYTDHSRLISFDRRGAGLSDPVEVPATLEEQMADVIAVLDACSTDRVVLEAQAEAAMLAVVFAATHPERVSHLILMHPMARMIAAPGYDWGWADEETRERDFVRPMLAHWGTGENGMTASPVLSATDPDFKEWWGRWERLSSSPGTMEKRMKLIARMDVREILPRVQAPSLILDRPLAKAMDSRHARYFAEHIPGGELVELPGRDAISFGDDFEAYMETVERFVTGAVANRREERALATVLFTDICGSTEIAAEQGDRRWRSLLERHDQLTRELVGAYGGVPVKSTGDGYLATFDGPARAVRCATELGERVAELGIRLRAGLHTGEVEVIGADVGGMAVHIGARIGALGGPGEVLTSSTVKDLVVGSGIEFSERGSHSLRGVPGEWTLFSVDSI